MKIIYVPDWMRAALEAANAPVADLYSVEKLLDTLSPEDVANYIHCQCVLATLIPGPIVQSFTVPESLAGDCKYEGCENSPAFRSFQSVLQSYLAHDNAPALDLKDKQLSCDLMDENTIRFTHVPLGPTEPSDETLQGETGLYDRVIRQLYSFTPFHELARLPVFAGYLTSVNKSLQPKYVA